MILRRAYIRVSYWFQKFSATYEKLQGEGGGYSPPPLRGTRVKLTHRPPARVYRGPFANSPPPNAKFTTVPGGAHFRTIAPLGTALGALSGLCNPNKKQINPPLLEVLS